MKILIKILTKPISLMRLKKKRMRMRDLLTKLFTKRMEDFIFMLDKTNIKVSLNLKIGLEDFILMENKKFPLQEQQI